MSIMVTGGKGFIGRRLVDRLRKQGNEVVVIDKEEDGVLNCKLLEQHMDKVSVIFHLGAVSGSLFFSEDPIHAIKVNCEGTVNLLEIAAQHKNVKKVIFAGTQSAYGFTPIPHLENGPVNCPNAYVASKLFGERMMRLYFENRALPTVCLRFASIYGMGEETKKDGIVSNPVTQFIWNALKGNPPKVFGQGNQTRDLVFVDDVVSALIGSTFALPGEVYNVSTAVETSMNEVIELLSVIHGKKIVPNYTAWKPYDQQQLYIDRQCASFDKLKQATGWKPRYDIMTGMRIVYGYYKEHPELVPASF